MHILIIYGYVELFAEDMTNYSAMVYLEGKKVHPDNRPCRLKTCFDAESPYEEVSSSQSERLQNPLAGSIHEVCHQCLFYIVLPQSDAQRLGNGSPNLCKWAAFFIGWVICNTTQSNYVNREKLDTIIASSCTCPSPFIWDTKLETE